MTRLESGGYGLQPLRMLAGFVMLEQFLGITIVAVAVTLSSTSLYSTPFDHVTFAPDLRQGNAKIGRTKHREGGPEVGGSPYS